MIDALVHGALQNLVVERKLDAGLTTQQAGNVAHILLFQTLKCAGCVLAYSIEHLAGVTAVEPLSLLGRLALIDGQHDLEGAQLDI